MKQQIYIISGPIQTGKTTALHQWISRRKNAGGILSPLQNEKRIFKIIHEDRWLPMETEDRDDAIAVGRFLFSAASFQTVREILIAPWPSGIDYWVVDEVGKLEIDRNEGFEPALSFLLQEFSAGRRSGHMVWVVRDSLLQAAIRKYGLEDAQIINSPIQL